MSGRRATAVHAAPRPCSRGSSGFTLIELLVVITMTAILLAIAAPSLTDVSVRSKVSDNANRLAVSAALARGEAIKRNGLTVMCVSATGSACATGGWEQGWIVFHDVNRNGTYDAGTDTILAQESAAPDGYLIREDSSKTVLTFQPTSVGTTNAQWTICRATPSVNSQQRQVNVSPTGRASVIKKTGTSCP